MVDDFLPVKNKQAARSTAPESLPEPPVYAAPPPGSEAVDPVAPPPGQPLPLAVATQQGPRKNVKQRLAALAAKLKDWRWLSGLAVVVLLLGGLGWRLTRPKPIPPPPPKAAIQPPPPPPPTTKPSRLSGLTVPIEQDNLPVTGVMIENSPDARPQSGLLEAPVIFEAIAEGGITRFLALYQTEMPDYIGPVRSVRPYYLDFLGPFDAGIAHAGGSGEALAQVRSGAFRDLDQMLNPGAYRRVPSRYAPHNLYTSRQALLELQNQKGWATSNFNGFVRKAEQPSPTPGARGVNLAISGYLYNVRYDYNPPTNSYNRSQGGRPHTDERSGTVLSPKVVIALVMPHSYAGIYSVYQDSGRGKAYVFQDGNLTEGFWEKPDRGSQLRFTDSAGHPLGLNPGQTWLTLVSEAGDVGATP